MSLVHPQLPQSRSHSAQQAHVHHRQTCEPHSYNIQAKLQKHVLSIFVHDTMANLKWRQQFTQICFPGHKLYDVAKTLIGAIQQMINHAQAPPQTHVGAKPITILVYNQWCYLTINGCNLPSFALRPIVDEDHSADTATPPYGFTTAAGNHHNHHQHHHHNNTQPRDTRGGHHNIAFNSNSHSNAQVPASIPGASDPKPKHKKSKKRATRNTSSNSNSSSSNSSSNSKVSKPIVVISKGVVARNIARFSEEEQQQTQSRGTKKKSFTTKVHKTKKKSRKNNNNISNNNKDKKKSSKSSSKSSKSKPQSIAAVTPIDSALLQRDHDRPSTPIPEPDADFLSMLTSAIQPPSFSTATARGNNQHHHMHNNIRLPVVSSAISSESTLASMCSHSSSSSRVPITRRRPSSFQRKNSVPPSYVLQTATPYFYGYDSNVHKHTVRCALAPSVESRFSASATDHTFRQMMHSDHLSSLSSSLQPYIPSPPVPKKAVSITAPLSNSNSNSTSRDVHITRSLSTQDRMSGAHTSMQTLGTNTNTHTHTHTNMNTNRASVSASSLATNLLTSLKPSMSSMGSISSIPSIASISSIASLPSIPCEQQPLKQQQPGQFKKVSMLSSIVPSTNTAAFGSDGSDYYDDEMEDELLMSSDVDNLLDENASLYKESKHGSMDSVIDSVCTADGMGDDIVTGAITKGMSQSPSSDSDDDDTAPHHNDDDDDDDEEEYKSESFECDFSGDDHYDIVRSLRRLRGYHDSQEDEEDDGDDDEEEEEEEQEEEYPDDDDVLRMQRQQPEGVKDGEYEHEYEYEYEYGYEHDLDEDDRRQDKPRQTSSSGSSKAKTQQLQASKTHSTNNKTNNKGKNGGSRKKKKCNPLKICLNGAVIGDVVNHVFEQQIAEEEYYDDEEFEEEPYYDPNYLGVNPYYDD